MAVLRRLTQARRSPTERTALAGEAAAEAAEAALRAAPAARPDAPAGLPDTPADRTPGAPRSQAARATTGTVVTAEADGAAEADGTTGTDGAPGRKPAKAPKPPAENHTPDPDDPRAAAFFDCDNTILRGAAIFYLGIGLYRRRFFTRRDVARFGWQQAWFRLHGTEDPGHMADAQHTALGLVAGKRTADLEEICEQIFEEVIAEKIWPGTRALVQMHLDAGQRVWLVTAAPQEVARIIARRLGMTGALGTVAEATDGYYTGRLVGELLHGPAKAAAVRSLARRERLDLDRCAAYSDSANDIPMLSLVGHPYVVNPDGALRRHARAMGWRVRDFRTGRKAARVGIPAAAALGVVAGATAAGVAVHRRRTA
ncbi:HAD-IB family hydrolase [Kitasatospora sp. NBC_00240]|uniref:HAD family hydrolase n=1 Tax=Kitasatospora sp. NBC_00240 TaxID=2903567 RepID=UPI0022527E64|nr:HAD-IB family hydrolase [Kitasatospora sp. NBC_00240]MCX5212231.1 HAD-IB family hydrolase [Kitasatospora sp. NBC_00240]